MSDVYARFHALVNMRSSEIRAWAKNPLAKCYSFETTRRRLPKLAALKAKPKSAWTKADEAYAKRVISFNSRFLGMKKQHGCTPGITIALRNWGHRSCKLPTSCKGGKR